MLSEKLAVGAPRPLNDEDFIKALPAALAAVESDDADNDGFTNLAEITGGSFLANADSVPVSLACSSEQAKRTADGRWNFCGFDPQFAFRRVHMDFCGVAPSRADRDAFAKNLAKEVAWKDALSSALDQCLKSRYWLGVDGAVFNLANAKIRPAHTTKAGANAGPIPLGDYDDDYNLFTYANSGDRDVRDLLLAQYVVKRVSDTPVRLEIMSEDENKKRARNVVQMTPVGKRAGMITTRWFSAHHTMFTAIPRTTAAQAFRAYLGFDIAKMQGLSTVEHEPADYDEKGVSAHNALPAMRPLIRCPTPSAAITASADYAAPIMIASGLRTTSVQTGLELLRRRKQGSSLDRRWRSNRMGAGGFKL